MSKTAVKVELVRQRGGPFTDTLYGTGITWGDIGDVREVLAEKWSQMKRHADVWREVQDDDPADSPLTGATNPAQSAPAQLPAQPVKENGSEANPTGDDPAKPAVAAGEEPVQAAGADPQPQAADAQAGQQAGAGQAAGEMLTFGDMSDDQVRAFLASHDIKVDGRLKGDKLKDAGIAAYSAKLAGQ